MGHREMGHRELAESHAGRRNGDRARTAVATRERPRRRRGSSRRPPAGRPPAAPCRSRLPAPASRLEHPASAAEAALISRWQRARASGASTADLGKFLVEANQSLLRRAVRWRATRLERCDLEQAAVVGLLRALEGFRPERGGPFGPYAIHWIRKELQRTVAAGDFAIAIPAHRLGDLAAARRPAPTSDRQDVSAQAVDLDVSAETASALRMVLRTSSVENPAAEAHRSHDPTAGVDQALAVAEALRHLPARTGDAVRLRYGLADGRPRTLREVATVLGVSDHTVRTELARAHERLRRRLSRD